MTLTELQEPITWAGLQCRARGDNPDEVTVSIQPKLRYMPNNKLSQP